MAKSTGFTLFKAGVFVILGLLALGFFWQLPKIRQDEKAQTHVHLSVAKQAAAGASSEKATDASGPGAAVQNAVKPAALPAPQENRWLDGETVWSSVVEKNVVGGLHRVRLVQSPLHSQLLRVEEDVTAGQNGKELQITRQKAMVATQLLIKTAPGVSQERLAAAVRPLGGAIMRQIPGSEVFLISIPAPDGTALPAAVQAISNLPGIVAYAEPDFIVHSTTTPNDTRFAEQWSLNNTGQTSGTADADIDAPEAWALTTGSNSVIVAVLDSGVDYTHPELSANMWTNPGEIAGNSIDDDGDGYVDDTRGWNFVSKNNTPLDDTNHGTHVAGIIGASGNNNAGISGVAWQVKLMPIKFLASNGYGLTSDAISGINYARVKGAHIINHSWGGTSFSQLLKDAIDTAGAAGILNVCAADNGYGTNEDVTPNYPSSFASASIVAVASTTEKDALSNFSDYGPTTVHLGAPGSNILSTIPNSSYGLNSGTSMATPHVSGIAALVKAYKPSATGADLKAILQSSVDVIPALSGRTTSGGRANALKALQISSNISVVPSSSADFLGTRGGPFLPTTKTYTLKNHGSASASWSAALSTAYYASVSPASGTLVAGASTTVTVTLNTTLANAAAPGLYDGKLTFTNTTSGKTLVWPARLDVRVPSIYSYDLSTDPGWAREDAWQFGAPHGKGGGGSNGYPDPTSAHSGSNVFGVNLNGDIPSIVNGPHYLVAGPFDLRGYTQTTLDYWRWLNTLSYNMLNSIEVCNESTQTWTTLWSNTNYVSDNAWTEQVLPLGADGDGHSAVYIRWKYEVTSTAAALTSGWNIDDIKITGTPGRRVFLDGVSSQTENTGSASLLLHVEPASPTDLTISLTSSDTTAATLPLTVFVPANTSSVSVTATLIDDALVDGTQTTVLSASTSGYTSIPWKLAVTDNETAVLSLNVPANGTEGSAAIQGTVSMNKTAGQNVVVALASSQPSAAAVPASVTIPAGQTSVTFAITLPQNGMLEGAKTANITATVTNWTAASASITVADDEAQPPTLTFPFAAGDYNLAEGIDTSSYTATVSLSGPALVDTLITLTMNDTSEMTLPASVTIPAGKVSATLSPITVIDDALNDGVQTVTVTAAAPGLSNGTANVTVADNEVVSFVFDYISSPQTGGGNEYHYVWALDAQGALAAGYNGTATISGLNHGTVDPSYNGSSSIIFFGGSSGSLNLGYPPVSSSYSIRAVAGAATGTSNSFAVESSPLKFASVSANEIAYDPVTNRVYASTSSGTVVPINPDTGATDAPITVSTGAVGQIEISTSGGILYAAVNNRTQLVKVDLVAKTAGTPFGLGSYLSSPLTVRDFAVLPNDSNTVGVVLYPQGKSDHVAIYTNGVKRTTVITYDSFSSNNPVIATQITAGGTANRFYASNGSAYVNSNRTLYLLDVGAGGVTLNRSYSEPGTLTNLTASGGLVADDTGRVYDGESGNSLGRIGDGNQAAVLLDASTGRACRIMHTTPYYYDPYALSVFELNGYSETGSAVTNTTVPATDGDSLPTRIVKAGTRTVAYRAASSVMLVKSFLLPDPATAAPDLAVQQMTAPYTIESGKPMSFNMLVRNTGSATAANVTLTSDWTPGAAYLGASTTQGTLARNGSHLTVNIGSLAVGKAVTVCLQLSGGSNNNRAVVTTSDTEPFTLNNVHAVSTYPAPNSAPFNYLPILGRDIVSSKDLQRVYAPNGFGGRYFAGTLAVMDLSAPAVRAFVPIGSAPGCLALSEDGATLFVGLDGTGQVVPVDVGTLTPGAAFTLGSAADGRRLFANDMAVLPGGGGNMVIARQDAMGAQAGVALFSNGAAVGTATPTTEFTRWVTAGENGGVCYGYGPDPTDFSGTSGKLYRMDVNGGGVSTATSRSGVTPGRRVGFASGRVLAANGKMFDATTLADAGALVDSSVYPYQLPLLTSLDTARERIYALSTAGNTPLLAFNSLTFAKTAQSSSNSYSGSGERLVRWGNSGLAFCAVSSNTNAGVYWRDSANLVPDPPLHVILPAAVAENAGVVSAAGTVQLTVAPAANLTVNLTSSNAALLQVPASVTVPAGQTSATFNLTVTNDGLLNGARSVTVTPSGPSGYVLIAGLAEVSDDETGILALSVPSSATEGAGIVSGQATVSLANGPAGADVTVRLSSNRTEKLTVPASVIIPAGQSTASFDLTLLNDSKLDGTQVVGITAAVTGWTSANASINVLDNEATTFTSSLGTEVSEGRGNYSITFYLTGTAQQDIVVSLTSSNPSKFSVPASVTIKAGTTGISFYGDVPNNTLQDGRQTVTITATAAGLTNLAQDIIVIDNDIAALQWGNIPNMTAGDFVAVSVTGTTIDGDPAAFQYSPTLTPAATRNGNSVGGVSGTLSLGGSFNVFTGNVRVTESGGNTILTVSQDGITASSNAFTVAPGPMSSFAWDAIPVNLPQPATPLSTKVYATDGYGNRLTGYSGTASLSAASAAGTAAVNTSGTSSITAAVETSKDQSRMTLLLFPNQINRSGRLRSLSLELIRPPGLAFDSFLIRAKQTSMAGVSTYWDNSGYTVLRQGALDLTQSKGWVEIPFTTPLDYDGTSNLQFDISFTTTGTAAGGAYLATSSSYYAAGNSANSSQGYGLPQNWATNNPYPYNMGFPNLKLSFGTAVTVTPTVTGNFTNGVWTGNVTFSQAAPNVVLIASNDISTGTSNVFEVGAVPPAAPVISTLPAYSATSSTTITWGAVATATDYYAEAATSSTFESPVANSGWITATSYAFTGLTDGTHYYYRVKARKVSLEGAWSNGVDSTQDSAGPKIYLSGVDDAVITNFTTTRSPVLIQGHITDTSGIASFVIISGGTTYPWTVNADGTWSVSLSTPSTGTFSLGFSGVDKASATANTTTRTINITRTADTDNNGLPDDWQATYGLPLNGVNSTQTADFDHDGRKNLLEYAFNTPPNSSAGNTLPSAMNEVKSADGKTYLIYRYDRRRGALDLTYSLEFSTDLATWSATSQPTELTGAPTLNADGITERVTTRILPDISQFAGQKVFVRLRVTNSTP